MRAAAPEAPRSIEEAPNPYELGRAVIDAGSELMRCAMRVSHLTEEGRGGEAQAVLGEGWRGLCAAVGHMESAMAEERKAALALEEIRADLAALHYGEPGAWSLGGLIERHEIRRDEWEGGR